MDTEWVQAFERRRAELGLSQREVGERIGVAQTAVAGWLQRGQAPPDRVFALEDAMGLTPGSLSRLLGYLPVGANECTVETALAADPQLSDEGRRTVLRVYEALVVEQEQRALR